MGHKPFNEMTKQERLVYDLKTGMNKVTIKRAKWKRRYYKEKQKVKDYKTFIKEFDECFNWLQTFANDLWDVDEPMRKSNIEIDDIEEYEINIHQVQYYIDCIKEARRKVK